MNLLLTAAFVSLLVTIAMTAVAWRASREEQNRADARVASLAADIREAAAASAGTPAPARPFRLVPSSSGDLFTTAEPSTASSRSVIVVCLGLFVFATVAALAVVSSGGSRATVPPRAAAPDARPATVQAAAAAPLELVALGQEQKADRLIVRGVIRNPAAGTRIDRLVAVVFVFDADGGFVTSGRAPIDSTSFLPGGESAFLVNIPGAEHAARYRVSFRTDTALVPHLDQRHAS